MFTDLRPRKLLVVLVACFGLIGVASAGPILTVPGDGSGNANAVGGEQLLAASWTQTITVANPVITVYNLVNYDTGSANFTFYLYAGSLPAPDNLTGSIRSANYTVAGGAGVGSALLPLALPGLTPETYYLVASFEGAEGAWRTGGAGSSIAGVTINLSQWVLDGAWTPDAQLNLGFQVSDIPEPATWVLVGAGLVVAGGFRRWRRS